MTLKNPVDGAEIAPSQTLSRSIDFSNLYDLRIDRADYLFEYISFPKLRMLDTDFDRGKSGHLLERLEPIASQIEKLVLHHNDASLPVIHGCPVPFINLVDLVVWRFPPDGSTPHLLLAPNLKSLDIIDHVAWHSPCLGYMLSPDGFVGPIRTLTRLRLLKTMLSHHSRPDYCTYYLSFHPHLESLTFISCCLPKDFLELMLNPLNTTEEFLPSLKELVIEDCQEPSQEWLAKLAILRPQLHCFIHVCEETL
jgi:hypothetical protein